MDCVPRPRDLTPFLRGLFVLVPLLLILNVFVFARSINSAEVIGSQVRGKQNIIILSGRFLFRLKEAEVKQRDYLLSGDSQDLKQYLKAEGRLMTAFAQMRDVLMEGSLSNGMVPQLEGSLSRVTERMRQTVERRLREKHGPSQATLDSLKGDLEKDNLRAYFVNLVEEETALLQQRDKQASSDRRALVASTVALTALDLFMLILTFVIWRQDRRNQETASRSLRESEERMMVLLNNSPVVMWALDSAGFCTMAEGQGAQFLGRPSREFRGKNYFDEFWSRPDLTDPVRQALSGRMLKAENSVDDRWFETAYTPILNERGRVKGMVGISVDITARKMRERDVELANQAKSRFLANMSHEIRTPLGIVLGFVDLALSNDATSEDKEKYLHKIRHNSQVLARLVDDILDLSKVEAGKLDVEHIEFSLISLLEDLKENFSLKAVQKQIRFLLEMDPHLPGAIKSDPVRLRQVLMNLIGNAIKFTDHGFVRLRVRAKEIPNKNNVDLFFEVEDTGIGIEPRHQERLFNPFTQADASTARRFGGTGLGLVLSRRLAMLLNGDLYLVSTAPGQGSVFELRLNVERAKAPIVDLADRVPRESHNRPVVKSERLKGTRVLLVEDAIDNQMLVKIILGMNGAEVISCNDGLAGVEEAMRGDYHIILMDIQMPRMDGFEAMQLLRTKGFSRPIIALTAHAMRDEKEQALRVGFDDYLTKPINRAELINVVESYSRKILSARATPATRPALSLAPPP
ncbi:MAG: response regulator [Bdellovibrionaceae bacterium]|nr:response regulator [Pseudobdellovibrionaceae bacterium]MBX3034239.1 response regulator [Pseudobdellovibrionaceae bacterium]